MSYMITVVIYKIIRVRPILVDILMLCQNRLNQV